MTSRASSDDEDISCHKELQTVHRAFEVLELLNHSQMLNASVIARRLGFSRGATCRILATLQKRGYVERARGSTVYRLSSQVQSLSVGYNLGCQLADAARPLMRQVKQTLIWPVTLSHLKGMAMETLITTDFDNPFAINRRPGGSRQPIYETAAGRVVLADMSDLHKTQYLSAIESELSGEKSAFQIFLAEVQYAQTYGFSIHKEVNDPEKAIAVPLKLGDSVCGALTARYIPSAFSDTRAIREVLPVLRSISQAMVRKIENVKGQGQGFEALELASA